MKRRSLILGAGAAGLLAGGFGWQAAVGSMADYRAYADRLRRKPDFSDLRELVRCASLCASSHNTQPWRFRIDTGAIEIHPDLTRRTPAVDPDDHHLFVSLGCAAENLAIAAGAAGRPAEIGTRPQAAGLRFVLGRAAPRADPLFDAIFLRQSTRAEFDGRPVGVAGLAALAATAAVSGVDLALVTDRRQIDRIRDLVITGNTRQLADSAFRRELKTWIRFNPRDAMALGDGLFSAASGNPSLPRKLGGFAFDRLFTAPAENDKYMRQIDSAAGLAVFFAERADPEHWIAVGRACQRFALQATALGLKVAFLNQPVEVAALRPDLAAIVGAGGRRPDLVMRFGAGPSLPFSPRRPVAETLT